MDWITKNWGWATAAVIGVLPLIGIMEMINLDFSGSGPWISMESFTMRGRHQGELPAEMPGASMAVKQTGEWAIRWIVVVLSLTPFSILTGKKPSLSVRQAAGITAFTYAGLHFLFFCIDKGWMETFKEVGLVLGLVATLVMTVLAFTSNTRSMKFLRKKWKKLHRLAYLAGILAVLHVALLKHGDWVPYLIILAIGFLLRAKVIKEWFYLRRNNQKSNQF